MATAAMRWPHPYRERRSEPVRNRRQPHVKLPRPNVVRAFLILRCVPALAFADAKDKDKDKDKVVAAKSSGKKLIQDRVVAIINEAIILRTELETRMVPVIGV